MATNLVMVEVSQKQAYIFSSNKLRDNIHRSDAIAYVTSSDYFENVAGSVYSKENNEVYCGGGHAILEFADKETAREFIRIIIENTRKCFPGMELFATTLECETGPSAGCIVQLNEKLEKKKSVRRASFCQGSFGVEETEAVSRIPRILKINGEEYKPYAGNEETDHKDRMLYPEGYERAFAFENLSVDKGESSFIAVVHIDGNSMGKRVKEVRDAYGNASWELYRNKQKEFSEGIASDFHDSFKEMCEKVAGLIDGGKLGGLNLKKAKNENYYFPIRRIITEGDDICFVTEGRIGIECARIFIELLSQKINCVDQKPYSACAGVAIVHQKYPFYKAYEIAEDLCKNAKKYVANITAGEKDTTTSLVSAIDWHLEFGELEDDVEKTRERYKTGDGRHLEMRPYIICGTEKYMEKERYRDFRNFRKIIQNIQKQDEGVARGKIRELRGYLRSGETAAINYMKANLIYGMVRDCYIGIFEETDMSLLFSGQNQKCELFVNTSDGKSRSILFDAVEAMDVFIPLDV